MAASPSSRSSLISQPSRPVEPAARAAAVWAALGQIFGRRFATEFGEKPSAYWVREVAELTDAQLTNGLARLRKESRQHPPSLGEFVSVCRNVDTPPRPHLTGLPPPPAEDLDHWACALNRMLFVHIWRAKGRVSPQRLQELLAYKRHVAQTLREAYPSGKGPQAELADMEAGINAEFARLAGAAA